MQSFYGQIFNLHIQDASLLLGSKGKICVGFTTVFSIFKKVASAYNMSLFHLHLSAFLIMSHQCVSRNERTNLGLVCSQFIGPILKLKMANPDHNEILFCPFLTLKQFIKHRAGHHHEEYVTNAKIHLKKTLQCGEGLPGNVILRMTQENRNAFYVWEML